MIMNFFRDWISKPKVIIDLWLMCTKTVVSFCSCLCDICIWSHFVSVCCPSVGILVFTTQVIHLFIFIFNTVIVLNYTMKLCLGSYVLYLPVIAVLVVRHRDLLHVTRGNIVTRGL